MQNCKYLFRDKWLATIQNSFSVSNPVVCLELCSPIIYLKSLNHESLGKRITGRTEQVGPVSMFSLTL